MKERDVLKIAERLSVRDGWYPRVYVGRNNRNKNFIYMGFINIKEQKVVIMPNEDVYTPQEIAKKYKPC